MKESKLETKTLIIKSNLFSYSLMMKKCSDYELTVAIGYLQIIKTTLTAKLQNEKRVEKISTM